MSGPCMWSFQIYIRTKGTFTSVAPVQSIMDLLMVAEEDIFVRRV